MEWDPCWPILLVVRNVQFPDTSVILMNLIHFYCDSNHPLNNLFRIPDYCNLCHIHVQEKFTTFSLKHPTTFNTKVELQLLYMYI